EKIAMKMKSENVNIEHVQISKSSPSGVATITKSPEDNSIIVIPGANSLVDPEDIQKRESLISESDILLSQLEIPLQTVNAAMKLAKKNGVLTVLNPAPYQTMDDEFLSYVDFITPNETEFLSMFSNMHTDTHVSLEEAMLVWQSKHKTRLIVTLGSNGCAYVENESVIKIPAYQVKVVDTTGAGDTFNGALAHCLAQSKDLNHSLRFAVKAGSLSVEQFGAQSGMPTLDQLQ
ncbi:MAG: ribokinase, partial [Eubacteriaceae bacterium]